MEEKRELWQKINIRMEERDKLGTINVSPGIVNVFGLYSDMPCNCLNMFSDYAKILRRISNRKILFKPGKLYKHNLQFK